MISFHTVLNVCDNSGARYVRCIKVLRGSRHKTASIGDIITVAVKESKADKKVKRGDVRKALILRTTFPFRRKNGIFINFDENAAIIINNHWAPIGTRIFGCSIVELRALEDISKILSLSSMI